MKAINFNSGGLGSYLSGKRAVAKYGPANVIHLFTDTKSEDEDLYRFLRESVAVIGGELVEIADGRNLWELFNQEGMIANTRADFCSRILKRELARVWIADRFAPSECVLYFGIDYSESHRSASISDNWKPYRCEFPLCFPPFLAKYEMIAECERDGIDPPRIYDEGFSHNNCNGFCVKGGHAHFLQLLSTRPDVFMENAEKEREFRERTGKDVAVLRDRRGGKTKPLPMLEFKRQIESGELIVDGSDWGKGCECFIPAADDALSPCEGYDF